MNSNEPITTQEQLKEYDALLCKLPGVLHVQFVLDEDGSVTELHVLASSGRQPKQIVRDIQSAMMAVYGIDIDHRVISVAQINMRSPQELVRNFRLICEEVSMSTGIGGAKCSVTLSYDGNTFLGKAQSSASSLSRQRMVAEATLEAVHQFLNRENLFSVADVKLSEAAGEPVAVVAVLCNKNQKSDLLIGATCQNDDLNTAIVKSTLDAINRKLTILYC